ncbi:MEDS domain-containing protein [Actinoplanes aureus]|uniref:MEDS domain-containing protein n=1 Tax=Actinoplanes aureus TaxID=2792083 RepID=A0A931CAE3_9ACTN|nr:MEDS domain-containing protein [Actinoplanes aureus]MBG0562488.1 MEDS domain-containing protein [Actinoplanes aureus]
MIDRLRLGDHACVVVDDDAIRLRYLATYVAAGLCDNHRVLYFGPGVERLSADLAALGLDTLAARERGQLRMATPEDSYLASGSFDPAVTIAGWRSETESALAAGYRGMRAIGDMSWAARPVPGAELLPWYEAQVNRVFAGGDAMAICLYDRRLFTDTALQRICWSHPATVDHETGTDAEPALRAIRTTHPPGIRLEGDADLSNRHALRAVMEHLVEDTPASVGSLTVDVSRLRFADAAAMRILMRTATTEAHRLRVVGCSPALRRLLTFNGADAVTGLTVEPAA